MIPFLLRLGMSEKLAKIFAYVGIPILILIAFYLALHAYGDARFDAGRDQADRAWKEAADRVEQDSHDAAAEANVPADQRAADWAARVEEEKAMIDAKISEGGDPFDVLFPADGRRLPADADSRPVSP